MPAIEEIKEKDTKQATENKEADVVVTQATEATLKQLDNVLKGGNLETPKLFIGVIKDQQITTIEKLPEKAVVVSNIANSLRLASAWGLVPLRMSGNQMAWRDYNLAIQNLDDACMRFQRSLENLYENPAIVPENPVQPSAAPSSSPSSTPAK